MISGQAQTCAFNISGQHVTLSSAHISLTNIHEERVILWYLRNLDKVYGERVIISFGRMFRARVPVLWHKFKDKHALSKFSSLGTSLVKLQVSVSDNRFEEIKLFHKTLNVKYIFSVNIQQVSPENFNKFQKLLATLLLKFHQIKSISLGMHADKNIDLNIWRMLLVSSARNGSKFFTKNRRRRVFFSLVPQEDSQHTLLYKFVEGLKYWN